MLRSRYAALIGAALVATALLVASVQPAAALVNGDFEAGSLAGWTVTDQAGGSGSWFADAPGTTTPLSGMTTSAAGGSPHGTTYAVSDQTGPGSHALTQPFTVGPSSSVTLTWDMFINNYDGGPTGTGLDYTVVPTEVGRVDILTSAASPFDIGAGVLENCFLGGAPGGTPNPFATFSCNITAAVGGGGTFQLRFAETDNAGYFNMGIDNVSISAVPEPGTLALLGLGLAALGFSRRKEA
jgi:hypothetical protein